MTTSTISEATIIRGNPRNVLRPFFSICIPQYNRSSFLLTALQRLSEQTFKDFEVCISDDRSTDGRWREIVQFLEQHDLHFAFAQQQSNQRYDGNLRSALALATGDFCILMGNDDCFRYPNALEDMQKTISSSPTIGVVIPNFADYSNGGVCRRVKANRIVRGSSRTAASVFRNLAFVSGIAFRRDRVSANASAEVDGSEMYQMYLGCRILAEGYDLLELTEAVVLKDIKIPGEEVDHYTKWPKVRPCPIIERKLPMVELAKVVYAGIRPYAGEDLAHCATITVLQLLLFTYPFWILEYRRVQSWRYAVGICLGIRPGNLTEKMTLKAYQRLTITLVYGVVAIAGLLCPLWLFDSLRARLHALAKTVCRPSR